MVNNYSKWLLFRCLCALIMVASFFATMIPAAIVQTYLAGTTCEGSIKQPSDQSSGVKQIIHPANVTNHDERDYVSVGLFAFIAGGVIVGTVLQATEFEHAAVTAVCAGGFFVLSTVQISSMLSTARDARSLDENTIAQILEAPVLEGDFCRTPILQDVEGVNAEAWTCALTAVLRGKDGWGSVQRACNSSIASRWIAMISCFAALLCTLTAAWYFANLLRARLVSRFGYKKAPSDPHENEVVEMS